MATKISKGQADKTVQIKGKKQGRTSKSKPPKQDAQFRKSLNKRVAQITEEVRSLLRLPQPNLIFAKEWLYLDEMPVPSSELLGYVACEMLHGSNWETYSEAATTAGIDAAFSCFIELTSRLNSKRLINSVEQAVARLTIIGWWGDERDANWWLCRWGVDMQYRQLEHRKGACRIAQAMTEILVARALHLAELMQIDGLARVAKAANASRRVYKAQAASEIALLIFKWYRHLEGKLKRAPSRAELKAFIVEVDPDVPTGNDAWNEGERILRYPLASPRSIHSDGMEITRLGLSARNSGPQYPLLPAEPKKPAEPRWVTLASIG
jgi:hypothetical protein